MTDGFTEREEWRGIIAGLLKSCAEDIDAYCYCRYCGAYSDNNHKAKHVGEIDALRSFKHHEGCIVPRALEIIDGEHE